MATPCPRTALMLVNRHSRRGAETDLGAFTAVLGEAGISVQLHEMKRGERPAEAVFEHGADADLVIIGGGDGTLNGAVPALLQLDRPLGILPLGTANDLARELGIPDNAAAAAEIIVGGKIHRIDVGQANDQWFFNAAGIGLGPTVTAGINGAEKARWGAWAYPKAVLRALRERQSFRARVFCDDRRFKLRALQLTVANGRHYGGGMIAEEMARVDDGILDLIAVKPARVIDLLRIGLKLRTGRIDGDPKLLADSGRRIRIETRKSMPVTTDGEVTTRTPVEFSVQPGAIGVYVPEISP